MTDETHVDPDSVVALPVAASILDDAVKAGFVITGAFAWREDGGAGSIARMRVDGRTSEGQAISAWMKIAPDALGDVERLSDFASRWGLARLTIDTLKRREAAHRLAGLALPPDESGDWRPVKLSENGEFFIRNITVKAAYVNDQTQEVYVVGTREGDERAEAVRAPIGPRWSMRAAAQALSALL